MAKSKEQKQSDLSELADKLKSAKSMVITAYRGTTVKDIDAFRKALRKESIFSKVYKITLLRKALETLGIKTEGVEYKEPVIVSISESDEVAPARIIKNLGKEIKTVNILQGYMGGQMLAKSQVEALADLPSKDQLRGMVVRTINAPVSGFVNVLAGNIRALLNVLNAKAAKN